MNSKEISRRQNAVWLAAALAAPLAQVSSGCSWPAVLTIGGVTLLISRWLDRYMTTPGQWLVILQGLWASAVLSQILYWIEDCWPEGNSARAVPLILLGLAVWSVSGERTRGARVGCVLMWPVGILLGAVLLSAASEIKVGNLLPDWQMRDAGLIPVLLMTVLYGGQGDERRGGFRIGVLGFAVLTAVAVTGVLSPGVSVAEENALYELSRSIRLLGTAERFESVMAAGMTLGYFATAGYLLSVPAHVENRTRMIWAYGALSGILFLLRLRIDSRVLAAGSLLFWAILPALCGIKKFFQKPPEST